jgi:hypothetical protein
MTEELYKQQAQRARDLAEVADPFIKKRLLALAEKYEARFSKPKPSVGLPPPAPRANSGASGKEA